MCHGDILVELVNQHCSDQPNTAGVSQACSEPKTSGNSEESGFSFQEEEFPKLESAATTPADQHSDISPGKDQLATSSVEQDDKVNREHGLAATGMTAPQAVPDKERHGEQQPKRRKHRTPHLHTANRFSTPKWGPPAQ